MRGRLTNTNRYAFPQSIEEVTRHIASSWHRVRGELRDVVFDDEAKLSTPHDQRRCVLTPRRPKLGIVDRRNAPLCHLVDDVLDAEAATLRELVADKIY